MMPRGRGDLLLAAALAWGAGLATLGACSEPDPNDAPWAKAKSASYAGDSARVVRLASRALGDSLPMRVATMGKGDQGWFIRLLPTRGGLAGGGTVFVDLRDSSATVVKRY